MSFKAAYQEKDIKQSIHPPKNVTMSFSTHPYTSYVSEVTFQTTTTNEKKSPLIPDRILFKPNSGFIRSITFTPGQNHPTLPEEATLHSPSITLEDINQAINEKEKWRTILNKAPHRTETFKWLKRYSLPNLINMNQVINYKNNTSQTRYFLETYTDNHTYEVTQEEYHKYHQELIIKYGRIFKNTENTIVTGITL